MISVARWSPCDSAPAWLASLLRQAAHAEQFGHPRVDGASLLGADPCLQAQARRDLDRDAEIVGNAQLRKDLGDLEGSRHAAPNAPLRATGR